MFYLFPAKTLTDTEVKHEGWTFLVPRVVCVTVRLVSVISFTRGFFSGLNIVTM